MLSHRVRPYWQWVVIAAAGLIWLWISHDGHLHWDEPSYLYTAAYVPWQQILYEGFEPSTIQGFNISRMGHLAIAKFLVGILGPGNTFFNAVVVLYLLLLLATIVVSYSILRLLMPHAEHVALSVSITLFVPMMVYLAWKTTPDIPALFFSTLASLCFLLSMTAQPLIWILLASLLLALTGLTKYIMAWQFISMAIALLLFRGYRWSFRTVLSRFVVVSIGALLIFGSLLSVLQVRLGQFPSFLSVASSADEPLLSVARAIASLSGQGETLA
jgi:hypothetical protein